jgi:predicted ATPase
MIRKAHFKNFKILREVCIDLQPLTVIVGPNSSGKTTILQALDCLTRCLSVDDAGTLRNTVFQGDFSPHLIKCREPQGQLELSCTGSLQDKNFAFSVAFNEGGVPHPRTTFDTKELPDFGYPSYLSGLARPAVLLKLDPRKLAAPSFQSVGEALPSDGTGLPALLAHLKLQNLGLFESLVTQLQGVVPSVRGITVRPSKTQSPDIGYEFLIDMDGADQVPAAALSEGTLLTLGLLTALSSQPGSPLVLIDDLERSLHPKALSDLVAQIRAVQEQRPGLQIIATSHSPYLIDCVGADEVLLTSLDDNGYSVVRSLTDHPEYERWKGFMAPGEFWSSVGEDWIIKEKKASAR